jgi:predicted TIM-barrel fold metal-dependent hydrolase
VTASAGSAGFGLFDANCQLGSLAWGEIQARSAADLLNLMDTTGISRALVSHTMSWRHDPQAGNQQILREVAGHDRLRPCWVALPDTCGELAPPREFARDALARGVAAIRVYPRDHGFDLDCADFAGCAAACAEAGLPILVDLRETSWPALESLAAAHPRLAVIVCEVGYRVLRRAAGVLARTANVYLDLSDLSTHEGLEWLAARFGPGRLIFGTGTPLRDPGEAITRLLWSDLDAGSVTAIAHETLDRLLPGAAR